MKNLAARRAQDDMSEWCGNGILRLHSDFGWKTFDAPGTAPSHHLPDVSRQNPGFNTSHDKPHKSLPPNHLQTSRLRIGIGNII